MEINKINYEEFFLDYLEGNLDKSAVQKFEAFLAINPKLKVDFLPEDLTPLISEPIIYSNKTSLKKFEFNLYPFSQSTIEEFCIAFHEHQLTDEKEKEFLDFLTTHSKYVIDFDLYGKTYLKPQLKITFENKEQLHHSKVTKRLIYPLYRLLSIAAGVALLVGIYLKYFNEKVVREMNAITLNKPDNTHSIVSQKQPIKVNTLSALVNVNSNFSKLSFSNLNNPTSSNKLMNEKVLNTEIVRKDTMHIASIKLINPYVTDIKNYNTKNNLPIKSILPTIKQVNKTSTFKEYALSEIKNNLGLEKVEDSKGKLSFFKILQAGVKGYNQLTDSNLQLTGIADESGKLTAMSFKTESGLFQVHHKRNK